MDIVTNTTPLRSTSPTEARHTPRGKLVPMEVYTTSNNAYISHATIHMPEKVYEKVYEQVYEKMYEKVYEKVYGKVYEKVYEKTYEKVYEKVYENEKEYK